MTPEGIDWLQAKSEKFKKKQDKLDRKSLQAMITESAGDIARVLTKGPESKCKMITEFAKVFAMLPEEKQKEIDALLQGVPTRIMQGEAERKKRKEEGRKYRLQSSSSRSKSPRKNSEEKIRRKKLFERKKDSSVMIDATKKDDVKTFRNHLLKKADAFKEMFPEIELEEFVQFVKVNRALSVDELAERFLAGRN